MAEFCEEHHIRLDLASVAHPESNGQAERANQSILHGLKPRLQVPLERTAGCWVEELPSIIWGIRTSVNSSTGFTPSSWCTVPRQSCPPTSTTIHQGWSTTRRLQTNLHVKTESTSSTRHAT